jgi:hypothetical protein
MAATIRKWILVVLLLLVASAYAYERFVVQRQPVKFQAELMDWVNDASQNYTEKEVLTLLNRPHETIFESEDKNKKIVKYTWQGFSWNKYHLYVVFRKFGDNLLLSDASMSEPSPTKPFIDPSQIATTEDESGEPEKRDGDVPTPARDSGSRGLIEGG